MPADSRPHHGQFDKLAAGLLLAMAVLLSALLLRADGTSDVGMFLIWGALGQQHGLVGGYNVMVDHWPDTVLQGIRSAGGGEYPPLGFAWLYLVSALADLIGISHFLAFKIAVLIFGCVSTAMIGLVSRSIALAAAFHAAIILNAAGLGYMDVVFAPCLIGALWAIRDNRPVLGFILLLSSILLKWQPLIIAPFLLLHMLKISDLRSIGRVFREPLTWRLAATLLAVVVGIGAVFHDLPLRAFAWALHHPFLSGNTLNVPWVVTFLAQVIAAPDSALATEVNYVVWPPLHLLPFKLLFFALYAGILLRFVQVERSFANCLLFSVLGVLTYGIWNAAVHENHWFTALVPAFVLAAEARTGTARWIAALVAAMLNVNLFVFYGVTGQPLMSRVVGIDLSVILALLFAAAWLGLLLYAWSVRPVHSVLPLRFNQGAKVI